jgi:hypothetical protein
MLSSRSSWGIRCLFAAVGALALQGAARASVLAGWDFNDGTTQGWTASGSSSNSGGRLLGRNTGNGSLQIDKKVTGINLTGLQSVSFDIEFQSYVGISAPSQLSAKSLALSWYNADYTESASLGWQLDLSGLEFGQTRHMTLQLADGQFYSSSPTLADVLAAPSYVGFLFSRWSGDSESGSAFIDNFEFHAVPEPATAGLLACGALTALRLRRGVRRPIVG